MGRPDYVRLVREGFSEEVDLEMNLEEWQEVEHAEMRRLEFLAHEGLLHISVTWFIVLLSLARLLHFYPPT